MTGAEHHARAEQLLDRAAAALRNVGERGTPPSAALKANAGYLAEAQVHALLALAASLGGTP